jgi:hypothetical protein
MVAGYELYVLERHGLAETIVLDLDIWRWTWRGAELVGQACLDLVMSGIDWTRLDDRI